MTLLFCFPFADKDETYTACLSEGIHLTDIVSQPEKSAATISGKKITVRDALRQVKARCKNGKLVDGKGKEIYFIRLIGCWGNPPEDYQEQLAKQEQALQRLKKKYTVIQISCNQTGDIRHIN